MPIQGLPKSQQKMRSDWMKATVGATPCDDRTTRVDIQLRIENVRNVGEYKTDLCKVGSDESVCVYGKEKELRGCLWQTCNRLMH